MTYTTIITEGGLLPADLIDQLATGDLPGQQPEDFWLEKNRRLSDEIAAAWGAARAYWSSLQFGLESLRSKDSTTSVTREQWVMPLLRRLGYQDITFMPAAARVDQRTYALSHRAGTTEDAPPIHIEGIGVDIERRPPSGRPRLSPHTLVQEYLNSTEHVWGIVTNGERLRLLRDSAQISRPRFVEFDLRGMMEGEKFSEFAVMYRMLHRTRLPFSAADAKESWLERYHQQAVESGGRVREGLRTGVEDALRKLGNGLLQHPQNGALRAAVADGSLPPLEFYRELLRLVYRLLFLMVAEERSLIAVSDDEGDALSPLHYRASSMDRLQVYMQHYSVSRLRRLVEQPGVGRAPYDDLWLGLQTTFRLFEGSDERGAQLLGLTPLNGDLFGEAAIRHLMDTRLRNETLLGAIRALSLYRDLQHKVWRRVNYSALDVEELGSVYESLLDYRPMIMPLGGSALAFDLVAGTERKTTGSYYTRPELVQELIKSALEPVIAARLASASTPKEQERALLGLTVCDPACGSGHFLLAAARRLGRELARVRSGEDQPTPGAFRTAVRDVIGRCIYGVDLNPLAVDLCKLALWIEGHNGGLPLSFLDHHIKHGNSLVGASRALIRDGIPDDAFKPVTGDEKAVANEIKKRNKQEREAWIKGRAVQNTLFDATPGHDGASLAQSQREVEAMPDSSVEAVRQKAERYRRVQTEGSADRTLFNLWTAAFFLPLTAANAPLVPTTRTVLDFEHGRPLPATITGTANALEYELHFFHWELEFPHVFGPNSPDGFDVVLGNPPWERIKLQEQEHWVDVPEIRDAANKAARDRLLKEWAASPEPLKRERYAKFEHAKYAAEATSRFIRASGSYPLTAVGDVNTYALFAELDRNLINGVGRTGIIVPTGIATDDSTKEFFGDVNEKRSLVSLYDFENREAIFAGVHRSYKFCLLTIGATTQPTRFVFFATNTEHLSDPQRVFELSPDEIALLNPNTRTCPVFRTNADAELTKKIYRRVPVLEHERTPTSPWGISFMRMFDMSNDSNLFKNEPSLDYVPLYEGRMVYIYDHRLSSFDQHQQDYIVFDSRHPENYTQSQYSVPELEFKNRISAKNWNHQWFFGIRRVTRNTDSRTVIGSFVPFLAVTYGLYLIFSPQPIQKYLCLVTILNSIPCDYLCRTSTGQPSLTYSVLKQLPVLPPEAFSESDIAFIVPRVLELVYTAWDMQPFAEDVWHELDEGGRREILARNAECNHGAPGEWFSPRGVFPLPPFQWNDERRATIRAELDARIARLYGLTRDELRYILDPADVYGPDFPGETFRVLKEKEIKQFGEYRTRRLVLAAWDKEHGA